MTNTRHVENLLTIIQVFVSTSSLQRKVIPWYHSRGGVPSLIPEDLMATRDRAFMAVTLQLLNSLPVGLRTQHSLLAFWWAGLLKTVFCTAFFNSYNVWFLMLSAFFLLFLLIFVLRLFILLLATLGNFHKMKSGIKMFLKWILLFSITAVCRVIGTCWAR